ncbi:MAG: hypothetical protein E7661_01565 [Ruminococcaceae bacterium]|nr:hypothetical protein [Oscillospiraceae bacterium]
MKKLSCLLLCLAVLLVSVSCAATPAIFTAEGLSLTLDTTFEVLEAPKHTFSAVSKAHMYVVTIDSESFANLEKLEYAADMSTADYAARALEKNEMEAKIQTRKDIAFYTYEKDIEGTAFTYMATFHRLGDAYWTVTFGSESKNFSEAQPQFWDWADTVTYLRP